MSVPTRSEKYAELNEHLIKAQEAAAMLGHLYSADGSEMDKVIGKGWLGVSEMLRLVQHQVIKAAKGSFH